MWNRCVPALALALLAVAPGWAQSAGDDRLSGIKLSGDQPIQIESERLELRDNDRVAIFSGNVNVTQGTTELKSGRMVVHYASGGGPVASGGARIEKLEVDGKVYVRSQEQVATGDRGVFDMNTETLVLTGDRVVLSEGDNVIVGCKLTVEMKSGQARFDGCDRGTQPGSGRIIMQIAPRSN